MRRHGGMAVFSSDLYFPLGSTEIAPLTSFQSSPLTLTGFFLIAQSHLTVYSGPFQIFHHQKIETFHQSWFIKRIQKKKGGGGECIPECLQSHLTGFSVSAADIQDLTFSLRLNFSVKQRFGVCFTVQKREQPNVDSNPARITVVFLSGATILEALR